MSRFQLTSEQESIIHAPVSNSVITAVAGSGKTTTLAYRIRFLLENGYEPRRLLVLMFNKSAQLDFVRKLGSVLDGARAAPEVRTFHAMGYRLMRRFQQEGALPQSGNQILSNAEIQWQLWRMIAVVVESASMAEVRRNKQEHLDAAITFIDQVKSQLDSPQLFFEASDLHEKFSYFPALFDHFESWRKQNRRISYADMLYDVVMVLRQQPALVSLVENKMDVILVDEYQDTNDIQHALLKLISGNRAKVTIVGDPDQTIYEFRGAKPIYMQSGFEADYEDVAKFRLSNSFRYGHQTALLANHLISHNRGRDDILCVAHQDNPRTQVDVLSVGRPAKALSELLSSIEPANPEQTAVLVRAWSQSIGIQLELLKAGIEFNIEQSSGVFLTEEFLAVKSLLVLATKQFDRENVTFVADALFRLMKFPNVGVSESVLQDFAMRVSQQSESLVAATKAFMPSSLKKFQTKKIEAFALALKDASEHASQGRTTRVLLSFYAQTTSLYDGLRSASLGSVRAEERVETVKAIIDFIGRLSDSPLTALEILSELEQEAAARQSNRGVLITTLHRAKGLEWDHVLIPDFNKAHFPYQPQKGSLGLEEIEAERRLLYVGITRAKKRLTFFCPLESDSSQVSPFFSQLNTQQASRLSTFCNEEGALPQTLSQICHRYLNATHPELDLDPIEIELKSPERSVDVWEAERVTHKILGEGCITARSANAFTVNFLGEERTFAKETAHRFFQESA